MYPTSPDGHVQTNASPSPTRQSPVSSAPVMVMTRAAGAAVAEAVFAAAAPEELYSTSGCPFAESQA